MAVTGRQVAGRPVALRIVGIAFGGAGIAAAGELQRRVVGEVPRAAPVGDGGNLADRSLPDAGNAGQRDGGGIRRRILHPAPYGAGRPHRVAAT